MITGLVWGPESETIKWIGDFFIKSIKMLVVPLIFFSLVAGVAALGDLKKLGSVGGRAMLLFVITGQIAAWLGLALGTFFQPGSGVDHREPGQGGDGRGVGRLALALRQRRPPAGAPPGRRGRAAGRAGCLRGGVRAVPAGADGGIGGSTPLTTSTLLT